MIQPTEKIVRAMVNLDGNLSWKEFVQWLEDSLTEQSTKVNHLSGEATIKMQGRNVEIEEILKHINKRHEYMKNYQGRK